MPPPLRSGSFSDTINLKPPVIAVTAEPARIKFLMTMKPVVTFVIPIPHQEIISDWGRLVRNLRETILSIAGQTNPNWRAVIVANEGADLPDVPAGFEIVRVDFAPNRLHDLRGADKEAVYEAVRLDKGRRILSGMLKARETTFFMSVDDDDLISNGIVEFASRNPASFGWRIDRGYVWPDGGRWLFTEDDFSNFCGTSLIVRTDCYQLPATFDEASPEYIKAMLGSHVKIKPILANRGTPLETLPFRGAIYRIGGIGAFSKSSKIIRKYFVNKSVLFRPHRLLANMFKLRFLDSVKRREFFGIQDH
jgi:hypothetical protein